MDAFSALAAVDHRASVMVRAGGGVLGGQVVQAKRACAWTKNVSGSSFVSSIILIPSLTSRREDRFMLW